MIIVVASSTTISSSEDMLFEEDSITRPLCFDVDSNLVSFPASEYKNIVKIFENAEFHAMRYELNQDSIRTITVGRVNQFRFDYRYTLPNYHFIVITDTITNKKIHMLKYQKFVDNLTLY